MNDSKVGAGGTVRPHDSGEGQRPESVERALDLCDRALELMAELQRSATLDPETGLQEAIVAVQGVRTELTTMSR